MQVKIEAGESHFVMNLSTSFTELLPLRYFHRSTVCPSTLSARVALMTLMEMAVCASLPHFLSSSALAIFLSSFRILHPPPSLQTLSASPSVTKRHLREIRMIWRPNVEEWEGDCGELWLTFLYLSICLREKREMCPV